jgi:membrane protease YdiL (CAAX protease family)
MNKRKSYTTFLLLPYIAIIAGLYVFSNIWVAMVSYHLSIILIAVFTKNLLKFKNLIKGWSLLLTFLFTLGCAVNGVLIYYLWPFISGSGDLGLKLIELGLNDSNWLLLILYYSLITPWLEEFFWRDLMASKSKFPDLSDVLFAGYHLFVLALFIKTFFLPVVFITLLSAAWFWRFISRKLGGLLIPVISHTAADISTILVVYLLIHN